MKRIEMDEELYQWLQRRALPFVDTPNSVIRRAVGLDRPLGEEERKFLARPGLPNRTPQFALWKPILFALLSRSGFAGNGTQVLDDVEKAMDGRLSDYDRTEASPGVIRWRTAAEQAVLAMREGGLLKPTSGDRAEEWALTEDGVTAVYVL